MVANPGAGLQSRPRERSSTKDLTPLLRSRGEALPESDDEAFGSFFDRFGDARVVLLGEATHGTSEFYKARASITRRLVTRHGFGVVAVEADWPDAARIDAYVRHHEPRPGREEAFTRFPTWMWRNVEVMSFVDWLRGENEGRPPERRVSFRGLDIYSLGASIEAVLSYLDKVDPKAAEQARRRYGCLTPWQNEPGFYGRAVHTGREDPCEEEAVEQLAELLARRLEYMATDREGFLDAAQNARTVLAAESYYRIMYRGSTESWNVRDRHMFETLQFLMANGGPDAKAIVWAHNSHIGDASATEMGWQGEFNIGELCRTAYGDRAVLIGFGTDHGTVAAASDWGDTMEIKSVVPARGDSYEAAFRDAGLARSLTDWRAGDASLREALAQPALERAIGVIYRPETERQSHYFKAIMADQFDAFVWFDETHSISPLPSGRPHGVPDTYPFGL